MRRSKVRFWPLPQLLSIMFLRQGLSLNSLFQLDFLVHKLQEFSLHCLSVQLQVSTAVPGFLDCCWGFSLFHGKIYQLCQPSRPVFTYLMQTTTKLSIASEIHTKEKRNSTSAVLNWWFLSCYLAHENKSQRLDELNYWKKISKMLRYLTLTFYDSATYSL